MNITEDCAEDCAEDRADNRAAHCAAYRTEGDVADRAEDYADRTMARSPRSRESKRPQAAPSSRYRQVSRKTEAPRAGRRASLLVALCASLVSMNAHADADADFAKSKKCMSCHAMDEKRIGPPYQAVASKYANDKDAEARLAKKIREGGTGAWGVLVMPPNDVTAAEAQRLAHWVLMQK